MTTATFDLNATIESIITNNKLAEQAKQRDQEERQRRATETEITNLKTRIRKSFGDELITALGMKTQNKSGVIRAVFTFDDIRYSLWWNPQYSQRQPWSIGENDYAGTHFADEDAAAYLLHYLAGEREKRAKWEVSRKLNEAREAREAAEKAEQEAARRATHERLAAMVDEKVNEARESLWQWPANVMSITLYYWKWQTGAIHDENGADYDYEDGWATVDRLDRDGYVALLPEKYSQKTRQIKLDMMAHKPIITRHCVYSVADLDSDLTEKKTIRVDGVYYIDDYYGGPSYFVESESGYIERDVGRVPLAWIRALVDGK